MYRLVPVCSSRQFILHLKKPLHTSPTHLKNGIPLHLSNRNHNGQIPYHLYNRGATKKFYPTQYT